MRAKSGVSIIKDVARQAGALTAVGMFQWKNGVIYRYDPLIETTVELSAGADVTHSRSFDTSEPSVAAVVGSINPSCTRYAAQIKLQGHRVEMVQVRPSQH